MKYILYTSTRLNIDPIDCMAYLSSLVTVLLFINIQLWFQQSE